MAGTDNGVVTLEAGQVLAARWSAGAHMKREEVLQGEAGIIQAAVPADALLRGLKERFDLDELHVADLLNPDHPPQWERHGTGRHLILRIASQEGVAAYVRPFSLFFDDQMAALVWPEPCTEPYDLRKLHEENPIDAVVRILHSLLDRHLRRVVVLIDESEDIEDEALGNAEKADLPALLEKRRELTRLARAARNNLLVLEHLLRDGRFAEHVRLSDAQEHMRRAMNLAEARAEHLIGVVMAVQSILGQRLNEVMKFLAAVTVILTPLAVITGVFGMNFEHMGILETDWGFPASLIGMAILAALLGAYFRWRRWL